MRGGRLAKNRSIGLLCATAFLSALAGCAAPSSYAGIDLAPGAATPELQSLATRAQAGDKHAQLELGIRYEEGVGVPVDLERARGLYAVAAATTDGVIYVYTPAVTAGEVGRTTRVRLGPTVAGLRQARELYQEIVKRDNVGYQ